MTCCQNNARRFLLPLVAFVLCTASAPAASKAASPGMRVYYQTLRSTGWVIAKKSRTQSSSGTCWVIDRKRRLAISNKHVVLDNRSVRVYFPRYRKGKVVRRALEYVRRSKPVPGRVLATDASRDLALIQLKWLPRGVRQVPLAAGRPAVGAALYSVGNSGVGKDVRTGRLWRFKRSKLRQVCFSRFPLDVGFTIEACLLALDGRLDHGDSGGPLVNRRGQLVGVVAAYDNRDHRKGYCIDAGEVRHFVTRALQRRHPVLVGRLIGPWKATFTEAGQEKLIGVSFQADGRVEMIGAKVLNGSYHIENEKLRLELDGFKGRAEGNITWESDDRFALLLGGTRFTFQRR